MLGGIVQEVVVEAVQDHVVKLEQEELRELKGRRKLSGELPDTVKKEKKHRCLGIEGEKVLDYLPNDTKIPRLNLALISTHSTLLTPF